MSRERAVQEARDFLRTIIGVGDTCDEADVRNTASLIDRAHNEAIEAAAKYHDKKATDADMKAADCGEDVFSAGRYRRTAKRHEQHAIDIRALARKETP